MEPSTSDGRTQTERSLYTGRRKQRKPQTLAAFEKIQEKYGDLRIEERRQRKKAIALEYYKMLFLPSDESQWLSEKLNAAFSIFLGCSRAWLYWYFGIIRMEIAKKLDQAEPEPAEMSDEDEMGEEEEEEKEEVIPEHEEEISEEEITGLIQGGIMEQTTCLYGNWPALKRRQERKKILFGIFTKLDSFEDENIRVLKEDIREEIMGFLHVTDDWLQTQWTHLLDGSFDEADKCDPEVVEEDHGLTQVGPLRHQKQIVAIQDKVIKNVLHQWSTQEIEGKDAQIVEEIFQKLAFFDFVEVVLIQMRHYVKIGLFLQCDGFWLKAEFDKLTEKEFGQNTEGDDEDEEAQEPLVLDEEDKERRAKYGSFLIEAHEKYKLGPPNETNENIGNASSEQLRNRKRLFFLNVFERVREAQWDPIEWFGQPDVLKITAAVLGEKRRWVFERTQMLQYGREELEKEFQKRQEERRRMIAENRIAWNEATGDALKDQDFHPARPNPALGEELRSMDYQTFCWTICHRHESNKYQQTFHDFYQKFRSFSPFLTPGGVFREGLTHTTRIYQEEEKGQVFYIWPLEHKKDDKVQNQTPEAVPTRYEGQEDDVMEDAETVLAEKEDAAEVEKVQNDDDDGLEEKPHEQPEQQDGICDAQGNIIETGGEEAVIEQPETRQEQNTRPLSDDPLNDEPIEDDEAAVEVDTEGQHKEARVNDQHRGSSLNVVIEDSQDKFVERNRLDDTENDVSSAIPPPEERAVVQPVEVEEHREVPCVQTQKDAQSEDNQEQEAVEVTDKRQEENDIGENGKETPHEEHMETDEAASQVDAEEQQQEAMQNEAVNDYVSPIDASNQENGNPSDSPAAVQSPNEEGNSQRDEAKISNEDNREEEADVQQDSMEPEKHGEGARVFDDEGFDDEHQERDEDSEDVEAEQEAREVQPAEQVQDKIVNAVINPVVNGDQEEEKDLNSIENEAEPEDEEDTRQNELDQPEELHVGNVGHQDDRSPHDGEAAAVNSEKDDDKEDVDAFENAIVGGNESEDDGSQRLEEVEVAIEMPQNVQGSSVSSNEDEEGENPNWLGDEDNAPEGVQEEKKEAVKAHQEAQSLHLEVEPENEDRGQVEEEAEEPANVDNALEDAEENAQEEAYGAIRRETVQEVDSRESRRQRRQTRRNSVPERDEESDEEEGVDEDEKKRRCLAQRKLEKELAIDMTPRAGGSQGVVSDGRDRNGHPLSSRVSERREEEEDPSGREDKVSPEDDDVENFEEESQEDEDEESGEETDEEEREKRTAARKKLEKELAIEMTPRGGGFQGVSNDVSSRVSERRLRMRTRKPEDEEKEDRREEEVGPEDDEVENVGVEEEKQPEDPVEESPYEEDEEESEEEEEDVDEDDEERIAAARRKLEKELAIEMTPRGGGFQGVVSGASSLVLERRSRRRRTANEDSEEGSEEEDEEKEKERRAAAQRKLEKQLAIDMTPRGAGLQGVASVERARRDLQSPSSRLSGRILRRPMERKEVEEPEKEYPIADEIVPDDGDDSLEKEAGKQDDEEVVLKETAAERRNRRLLAIDMTLQGAFKPSSQAAQHHDRRSSSRASSHSLEKRGDKIPRPAEKTLEITPSVVPKRRREESETPSNRKRFRPTSRSSSNDSGSPDRSTDNAPSSSNRKERSASKSVTFSRLPRTRGRSTSSVGSQLRSSEQQSPLGGSRPSTPGHTGQSSSIQRNNPAPSQERRNRPTSSLEEDSNQLGSPGPQSMMPEASSSASSSGARPSVRLFPKKRWSPVKRATPQERSGISSPSNSQWRPESSVPSNSNQFDYRIGTDDGPGPSNYDVFASPVLPISRVGTFQRYASNAPSTSSPAVRNMQHSSSQSQENPNSTLRNPINQEAMESARNLRMIAMGSRPGQSHRVAAFPPHRPFVEPAVGNRGREFSRERAPFPYAVRSRESSRSSIAPPTSENLAMNSGQETSTSSIAQNDQNRHVSFEEIEPPRVVQNNIGRNSLQRMPREPSIEEVPPTPPAASIRRQDQRLNIDPQAYSGVRNANRSASVLLAPREDGVALIPLNPLDRYYVNSGRNLTSEQQSSHLPNVFHRDDLPPRRSQAQHPRNREDQPGQNPNRNYDGDGEQIGKRRRMD